MTILYATLHTMGQGGYLPSYLHLLLPITLVTRLPGKIISGLKEPLWMCNFITYKHIHSLQLNHFYSINL